jgi:hypothetical protein
VALVQARGGVNVGTMSALAFAGVSSAPPTSSAVLQAMQRVAELEAANAALRSEVVFLHKSQHDMRENVATLSQRLLEAEIARDVSVLSAESASTDPEQLTLVESLRRRIHELETSVLEAATDPSNVQVDGVDTEPQAAQQAMLTQVADMSMDIKAKQELLDAYCKTDVEMENMKRNYESVIVRLEDDISKVRLYKVVPFHWRAGTVSWSALSWHNSFKRSAQRWPRSTRDDKPPLGPHQNCRDCPKWSTKLTCFSTLFS